MNAKTNFRHMGTMLDCSRNAVPNRKALEKWIDILSDLGYDTLMLYTEDTYEVEENPYFGYMRGRYTPEELKQINAYAAERGVELVPCIQTLAHLNAIVRWPAYAPIVDCDDILLAGDEKVYELIDHMFATLSKCFTSRLINIGMDEAHMIGRGKYYDLHGDTNRSELLVAHIKRVAEIGKKYGFQLLMWSDMFFRLATGGNYYADDVQINDSVKAQIPDNVQLIYWDYYSQDQKRYAGMLKAHEKIKEGTWFAGGLWTWTGFTPHNRYSIGASEAALAACREAGIEDVFMTMWGDDGAECSIFSLLPSLFYVSELAKGNADEAAIKAKFEEKYGIAFDAFMMLDLAGPSGKGDNTCQNPEKYLLYNDCFTGLLDCMVQGGESQEYAAYAEKLQPYTENEEWGYLFETVQKLCEALAVKAELGVKTREVYAAHNMEELPSLISQYEEAKNRVSAFHKAFKAQWMKEKKAVGFDVQDIRLGGVLMRLDSCKERLQDLYDGKLDQIEELEETQLDLLGKEEFSKRAICWNSWEKTVTANVL